MNQRLTAALLVGISVAFIAAEILVAVFGSFDQGWMVLFLSLYAGFVGLLFGLSTLLEGRREEVESVSERRARARRDGLVGNLLDDYEIDEEFLGRGVRKPRSKKPSPSSSSGASKERIPDDEELKAAVTAYAGMVGGIVTLRETIESMDDSAFLSMARKAGMGGVTRERVLALVVEMVSAQGPTKSDESPALSLSIDKESFDDYIKRCMTEPEVCIDDDATDSEGFSVGLDASDLSSRPGTPPTEFSHDPKAVMERFKRSTEKR
ncbi:MAG TPA: hypothetical protein DEB17_09280 [Chlorobaculum sp.]|uniref:Uncharacterized protein n=1 Tax=Chlorobaculum tepidum (strain ATCC 49652 / DSM 12025 / NBRC 103806 / TLS) TaxID=194439 RepID=Q8KBA0_CHLTE|nr:hypothetical protein [Chlorobaculum tepidum]AAM73108.1 hypothetical protein CT1889 [Chlorobaculum tepidum TLS]HBU24159.1 hypothetical protein [Chlorobaculum sp.]